MNISHPTTEQDFISYYEFRWQQLFKPWDQPKSSSQDELEESSHHLFALDEEKVVVGAGRVQLNSPQEAQIRYMAVRPSHQGQGIGRQLIESLEQIAVEEGASTLMLNARENARGFYEKLGYTVLRDGHTVFGVIKHFVMQKDLLSDQS